MDDSIYLDHNATAPMLPQVADAVREAALRYRGNPASQHEPGRQARRALEAARETIGALLGAETAGRQADRVIFTSGGAESNNLAVIGLTMSPNINPPQPRPLGKGGSSAAEAVEDDGDSRPRLVISSLEHPTVAACGEHLASQGVDVKKIPASTAGVTQYDGLPDLLAANTRLVSVMLANNETGVLQPVREIAAICRRRGVPMHTDATQAVGKISVGFRDLDVDALTATAHKFHGPLGIGVLVLRHGVSLAPLLHGGFQQAGFRPGSESVALAVGMQTALELAIADLDSRRRRMSELRNRLERLLLAGYPAARIIGADAPRLPHTSNVAFVGLDRQALVMALDLAGVACSTGSACASGSSEPSPALVAMGLPEAQISSSLRFSLGATTTAAEVDEAARRILKACNQLRR